MTFDATPSVITLRFKNAPADEVFNELGKQANVRFQTDSEEMWAAATPTITSIDLEKQPFWVAFREVCQASGVQLATNPIVVKSAHGTITLTESIRVQQPGGLPRDPWAGAVASGPVMLVPFSLTRYADVHADDPGNVVRRAVLYVHVMIEPKLQAVPVRGMRVETGEDQLGRPIQQPPERESIGPIAPAFGGPPTMRDRVQGALWRAQVPLVIPAADSQRITKLKGFVEFAVIKQAVRIEIPDVLNVSGSEHRLPSGVRVLMHEAAAPDRNQIQLRIGVVNDGAVDREQWEILRAGFPLWARTAQIETDGGELQAAAYPHGFNVRYDDVAEAAIGFRETVGGPPKLVWNAPTEVEVIRVPIELKDLPLP